MQFDDDIAVASLFMGFRNHRHYCFADSFIPVAGMYAVLRNISKHGQGNRYRLKATVRNISASIDNLLALVDASCTSSEHTPCGPIGQLEAELSFADPLLLTGSKRSGQQQ
ncbi:hypothetical protein [Leisingera sp. JC1]|uniref:hypothetical protein n=1 Tax=Leisingera sp. JC1 TaxID=1855282 RepID=UPI000802CBDD|nr:hypothetical protein [Leisingera sp. JC1]OBY25968.1 hypothetical protein A9D60_20760 [Leisingera sp. JC1]